MSPCTARSLECGMRLRLPIAAGAALALSVVLALGANLTAQQSPAATSPGPGPALQGIHKIQHVIMIMQENRSFDSYFGAYPGAAGIPMNRGVPTVCVPDPMAGTCVKPYVLHRDSSMGGPHTDPASARDIDHGKMDGFIAEAESRCGPSTGPCAALDVMGYHTGTDIPNYWAYAKHFVLDDMMFESDHSWSLPSHLALTSGWSAACKGQNPVSWGYYLDHGSQSSSNSGGVPQIWNVLPAFSDVHQDNQIDNIQPLTSFMAQAKAGTLPQVSWIVPNVQDSEHPPAKVSTGQAFVTRIINAVMSSSDWNSSAIFLVWDDWSGMYDNVVPPAADSLGYGIRVPVLVISPYARRGLIDSQTLSFDAYLRFIEDDFLGGARLDPATDGRPDSRPGVRENLPLLGDLTKDFNFSQAPLPPLILDPCPANTTLTPTPTPGCNGKVKLPPDIGAS